MAYKRPTFVYPGKQCNNEDWDAVYAYVHLGNADDTRIFLCEEFLVASDSTELETVLHEVLHLPPLDRADLWYGRDGPVRVDGWKTLNRHSIHDYLKDSLRSMDDDQINADSVGYVVVDRALWYARLPRPYHRPPRVGGASSVDSALGA